MVPELKQVHAQLRRGKGHLIMSTQSVKRNIFQRILGLCATRIPADPGCWRYDGGDIVLDLSRVPQLNRPGGAVRLEGRGLPHRLVVCRGMDNAIHVFVNRCGHAGRRVDPTSDGATMQCCSVGKSTYALNGEVIAGPARNGLRKCPVREDKGKLYIGFPKKKGEQP